MENNKDIFSQEVELFVSTTNSSYLDAILHLAEKKKIEIETVGKLLNKIIKQKLEAEVGSKNMLKVKVSALPM